MLKEYKASLVAAGRASNTIVQRVGDVERFMRSVSNLEAVTAADVTAYFAAHPQWKPEYRKKVATSLRLFFRWAGRERLIHDPSRGLPVVRVPRFARPPAPDALIEDVLRSAPLKDRAVLLLGATLGLRRTEIATLHPRDRLERVLTVTGKGGHSRRIPLDDHTLATLRELEREQGADSYYFPGTSGTGHVHPCTIYKWVRRMLGPDWTPHSLRRRAGHAGFQRTTNIRAVQTLLGHASLDTTALYVHVDEDDVAEVTAATSMATKLPLPGPLNAVVMPDNSVADVLEQIMTVSARARAAGLNVILSVESHTDRTTTM
ncbi:tyrosine-type recombinase/integrase [Microbacterium sp. YY-01]|uniref:tyrosine-type recombinase/integrase n=1 Tax=Microbacterium sp. YY-01 TaxID=3421634 RepID=UPI003D1869C7